MKKVINLLVLTSSIILVIKQHNVLAVTPISSPTKDTYQLAVSLVQLRVLQRELESKITICNGGKILTRACPVTNEPTGNGSLVKALQQTKQTISTLELYLNSIPPNTDRK